MEALFLITTKGNLFGQLEKQKRMFKYFYFSIENSGQFAMRNKLTVN